MSKNFKMPGAPYMGNRDVEMGVDKSGPAKMSKNFEKSGMKNADGSPAGPPFVKGLLKGAKNLIGKGAKSGLFGPLGMLASRIGGNKNTPPQTNTTPETTATADAAVNTADPVENTDINAQPNMEENPVTMKKHKGAPKYKKTKKGAPKLTKKQEVLDKNKNNRIDKGDFDIINKKGAPKYKKGAPRHNKKGAPNYKKGYYGE